MSRYLFGPITPAFADQNLRRQRAAGNCLAFGSEPGIDVQVMPNDTWATISARLPAGFTPDFVVLSLAYSTVPDAVWDSPVPLISLAPDWHLLWHRYRSVARGCELFLTDSTGVDVFRRAGIEQALCANLYGCGQEDVEGAVEPGSRDIDVLFVGNLNPAVQVERLPWLARLARLEENYKVVIQTALSKEAYRQLLRRAKIVFSRNRPGRWSRRVFEAVAAGALEFHQADVDLAPLQPGEDFVAYRDDNLEDLLQHYLSHSEHRERVVERARQKRTECTWEFFWEQASCEIEERLTGLQAKVARRPKLDPDARVLARVQEFVTSSATDNAKLTKDLDAALRDRGSGLLAGALATVVARRDQSVSPIRAVAKTCLPHFENALRLAPENPTAGLNLAEALALAGRSEAAKEQAQRTLALLTHRNGLRPPDAETIHFPVAFDTFRIEWERAAWQHAGDDRAELSAKRALLRWRLHALLAELTNDPAHAYEAYLLRPDLTASRGALGLLLARTGHPLEAILHLRRALEENPFDGSVARTLFHVLGPSGDPELRRALVEERRRLALAAPQVVCAEGWFAHPLPAGDELASIIIPCCNQLGMTQLCLESLLRHTRQPLEIILVDNGSTDETPSFLAEFSHRSGPVRVEIIRNETNRGFPAGCNQGLSHAQGHFIVFLNNDTIVTENWLEGLVARAIHDWPHVGLVGAVTNYAPEPQGIPCSCSLDELAEFAARRRREYAGKVLPVKRLSGFCLLARREVLDRIGGFDERLSVGFFDDDLGIRAREAGLQMLVALDVFVHHIASPTFCGLGINARQQLRTNFDLFRQKWGEENTKGYRLIELPETAQAVPDANSDTRTWIASVPAPTDVPSVQPAVARGRCKRVTLTLIVKNEEKNLPDCLATSADLVDQVIVVDTGSTDETKAVAQKFGTEVYDFPWVDDFAAARNECLRYATGDWNIWLDADDRLDAVNRKRLAEVLDQLGDEKDAYAVKVRSRMDSGAGAVRLLDQVRIFPNHPQVRWEYRVHEQILPAVRRRGGNVRWTDVIVDHVGYIDPSVRRQKLERNLRILELDNAQRPDDPFTLFNLGWTTLDLGRTDEAMRLLRRSLERSASDSSIVRKLYVLLTQGNRLLGNRIEALALCREGQRQCPDDLELPFEEAHLCRELGNLAAAERALVRILEMKPSPHFASVDPALRGWRTQHLLASIYLQQGKLVDADRHGRLAVNERRDFVPAWLILGDVAIARAQWSEVDGIARQLREHCRESVDALILTARAALTRREFQLARPMLEEAIAAAPQAVGPRVLLTHVLLQEAKDWAATEKALRNVLALAPGHPEVQHNLEVLLRQQGRDGASGA